MNRSEENARLLAEYRRTRRPEVREQLLTLNRGIVLRLAGRFTPQPAAAREDLVQIGFLGLLQAIDRFDPAQGRTFIPFAITTISGVIRRTLRDTAWALHAPRRIRELLHGVRKARAQLETVLGRSPSSDELSAHLRVPEKHICQALELERLCFTRSLDELYEEEEQNGRSGQDPLFVVDPSYDSIVEQAAVGEALSRLTETQRTVILGRYYSGQTQADVAARLGISQMQVSRLERKALALLWGFFTPDAAIAASRASCGPRG